MTDVDNLIALQRKIIKVLPDSHIPLFNEYNDIIIGRIDSLVKLSREQNTILESLAIRNEN